LPAPSDIVAVVTGAARGMGRAMTLALANAGVRVVAADLASAQDAMREVLDQNAVATAIDRFGAVHGLVNNAGIAVPDDDLASGRRRKRKFFEHDAEAWRRVLEVNNLGPFQMAKAIAPKLIAQGWGRIVNVTTSYTTMVLEGFSPYGPSKASLEAASVIWAKDLAGTGVTVNVLMPGGAGNTRMIPLEEMPDRATLVQPEVMMAPIVWLMSAASDGVTGRRFTASKWNPALAPVTAAEQAGAPAGWPT
jgi:3-oxoacyl-[acyl-carrier protein] reductase